MPVAVRLGRVRLDATDRLCASDCIALAACCAKHSGAPAPVSSGVSMPMTRTRSVRPSTRTRIVSPSVTPTTGHSIAPAPARAIVVGELAGALEDRVPGTDGAAPR